MHQLAQRQKRAGGGAPRARPPDRRRRAPPRPRPQTDGSRRPPVRVGRGPLPAAALGSRCRRADVHPRTRVSRTLDVTARKRDTECSSARV